MTPARGPWLVSRSLSALTRPIVSRSTPIRAPASIRSYAGSSSNPSNRAQEEASQRNSTVSAKQTIPQTPQPVNPITQGDEPAAEPVLEIPVDALGDEALEAALYGGRTAASTSQGGLTGAQEEMLYREGTIPAAGAAEALVASSDQALRNSQQDSSAMDNLGHKWPLPSRPFPDDYHHRKRYHPVLHQISRLLMRDGKLSAAQRNLALVMNHLRTSPAPIYSPKFPLLPGTPPAAHLPLNPILYLTIAIDSVAPIIRVNRIAGAAGGGRALDMPMPLAVRARRRQAFQWIMDSVNNKPSRGSGRKQLPVRIAEEIIAVVEGRSGVWDKRKLVHKVGTAARGNVGRPVRMKKGKSG